jgi:hypothetical protein
LTTLSSIYLVSCVGEKRPAPCPAKDLYISDWFLKARHYVEATGSPWFILSALYGLVSPNDVIAPYNQTLNTISASARRAWADRVRTQMDARLPDASRIVILAGKRYREGLMSYLQRRAPVVEVPMEGLRIGLQLAWLKTRSST